jgi:hypothetical protein
MVSIKVAYLKQIVTPTPQAHPPAMLLSSVAGN